MTLEILFIISVILIIALLFLLRVLIPSKENIQKRIEKLKFKLQNYEALSVKEKKKLLKIILKFDIIDYEKIPDIDLTSYDSLVKQLYPLENYLLFPFSDVAKLIVRWKVYYYVNIKLAVVILFSLAAAFMIFFYYLIYKVFYFIFSDAEFVFINIPIMILLPIGIFSLCVSGFFATKILNLDYLKKRMGDEFGEEIFLTIYNPGIKGVPKTDINFKNKRKNLYTTLLKVLLILCISSFIFTMIVVDDYFLVEEEGVKFNSFFSLTTNQYSWDEVDHVYLEMGRVLRDNKRFSPYDEPSVVILTLDDTRIDLKDKDEINNLDVSAVYYILNNSGLEIEQKIWNVALNQYLDYSEEVINQYEYYDK